MSQTCPNCGTANSDTSRFCMNCATPLRQQQRPRDDLRTGMLPANAMLQSRYIIVERLGRGGMGAVYAAVDARISGKRWAVKEMSDALITGELEKEQALAAFRAEAEMLAHLSHPNLPAVTDYFTEGGKQYLVMELVQGQTLEAYLANRSEPVPEEKVKEWAGQLCNVLTYLHERNPPIVFRDLKPSNIMLDDTGRIKLIDFGIARFFKAGRSRDTVAMGTPGYAAPEQYGQGQTDARSDIYSLGVTMHTLLTRYDPGLSPFNLPAVRELNPAVSPAMDAVVSRSTRTNPHERYDTIVEMQRELTSALPAGIAPTRREGNGMALPRPVSGPGQKAPGRGGVPTYAYALLAAAALFVCLLVTVGVAALATQTDILDGLLGRGTEVAGGDPPIVTVPPDDGGNDGGNDGGGVVVPPTETPTEPPPPPGSPTEPPPPPGSPTETPTEPPPPDAPTATPTELPPELPIISFTIGSSAGGRPIEAFQVGDGPRAVVVIGGLHAGFAPSSVLLVERLLDHLRDNPEDLPAGMRLYLFPRINMDAPTAPGELAGRLNANGVDLNRNWNCNWSSTADWRGTPVDPGDAPFSEPESAALRDFLLDERPAAVISYEARATNGIVSAGRCGSDHSPSLSLTGVYASAAGYETASFDLNGDSSDWMVSQDIPAISILLKEYNSLAGSEWADNLSGVLAVLRRVQ